MTWPSKDPANYTRRTRSPKRVLIALLLLSGLAATLVANAVAIGDVTVAPAMTAALGAILLVRYHRVRSRSPER